MDSVTVDLDFFPARVTLPSGGVLKIARLYVANGEVIVFTNQGSNIKEFFRRKLVSVEGNRRRGYSLMTEMGEVKVTKAPGCGCSNPLKRYNPWPGVRRLAGAL